MGRAAAAGQGRAAGGHCPAGCRVGDEDSRLPGYDLPSRLTGMRPGTVGWPACETYCEDLLSFLFVRP